MLGDTSNSEIVCVSISCWLCAILNFLQRASFLARITKVVSVVNKLITDGCVIRLQHAQVNFLWSSPSATLSISEMFENYLKTPQYDRECANWAKSSLVKSFVLRCGCRGVFTSDTHVHIIHRSFVFKWHLGDDRLLSFLLFICLLTCST